TLGLRPILGREGAHLHQPQFAGAPAHLRPEPALAPPDRAHQRRIDPVPPGSLPDLRLHLPGSFGLPPPPEPPDRCPDRRGGDPRGDDPWPRATFLPAASHLVGHAVTSIGMQPFLPARGYVFPARDRRMTHRVEVSAGKAIHECGGTCRTGG